MGFVGFISVSIRVSGVIMIVIGSVIRCRRVIVMIVVSVRVCIVDFVSIAGIRISISIVIIVVISIVIKIDSVVVMYC